ncbi:MAG: amidohydrolase family protein, partial [Chthonomonadales bacterium]
MRNTLLKTLSLVTLGLATLFTISVSANSDVFIQHGTILTVTKGTIKDGDILIKNGKIVAIGRNLPKPAGIKVIDATGKFVMPGIIDAHSHMAAEGGINESTEVAAAEVNIYDVINQKDPGIKLALAGGVTTINTMHGSANPIGGLVATLKLRWGKTAEEMKFAGARQHIKFALGENPRRVHADRGVTTRLGVADALRNYFTQAREYNASWEEYRHKLAAGEKAVPPRKDLKLESMGAVLKGDIWVQCHCYRADEIEMLLKLSDEFGFKIGALQHVLEGYKIAPEIAKRGIGASTFADFWGYKLEAYDGNVYNAAAMVQAGIRTSVNSDSGERIRRLNLDAAKSLRYGGLNQDQCLGLVTIEPAWQLGIDKQVGSLEVGKDADISIWDAHPLSAYSKCVMTLVDGENGFVRGADGKATFGSATPTVNPIPAPAEAQPVHSYPVYEAPFELKATPLMPTEVLAITDAVIHTVSGPVINHGTVVIENGRFTAVGERVEIPRGARVIDARGQHIYPGFINATGQLGLTEIAPISESVDTGERGTNNPMLRAADAYHTSSAWIGLSLCTGIT